MSKGQDILVLVEYGIRLAQAISKSDSFKEDSWTEFLFVVSPG